MRTRASGLPVGFEVSSDLRPDDRLLSALAEFAAGAGHEINNPLGSILICSERLLRDEQDPERRRLLRTIGGQALRIRDMIGDAMLFARPPAPDPRPVDLSRAVCDVMARFSEAIAERGALVEAPATSAVFVLADPTQLSVVISELLRNALEAIDEGEGGGGRGRISLQIRAANEAHPRTARLVIADNGRGLSEQERIHLFDPFFSGRQAGRGLGFGLPKAWRIVRNHGGEIAVTERPEGGIALTVDWPIASP